MEGVGIWASLMKINRNGGGKGAAKVAAARRALIAKSGEHFAHRLFDLSNS